MSTWGSMPWEQFTADPRDPAAAGLRASDRDRDVVLGILTEAYADGRITREEHDERAEAVTRAKTLGELPPVVADLVRLAPAPAGSRLPETTEGIHEQAVRAYEKSRREALSGFVITSAIVTVIWAATSFGGFFWPVFVMMAAGANLLRVIMHKSDIIEDKQREIERKQRRQLEGGTEGTPGTDGD